MNIKAKVVNPVLLLVTSVVFLGIGICILIDHDLASRVLMIGIAIAIIVAGITPVSYTHLDVYKRQM